MKTLLRRARYGLAAVAIIATSVALLACAGSPDSIATPHPSPSPGITVVVSPSATTDASPSPQPPPPTPTPQPLQTPTPSTAGLTGFTYPLEGACLPASDNLMPNAPREYRSGVHEGVDFYPGLACTSVALGTPVLAAKDGVVVRADIEFVEMTAAELDELLSRSQAQGYTDAEALDRFRGRQVWIDHGDGVVTRYAHLNAIASGIDAGVSVQAGQLVGHVGNSGTPEAVTAPGTEMHLHFEFRVGDTYLGAGLAADQVRGSLERAFASP